MPELDALRGVAILLVLFFHGFGFALRNLAGLPRAARLFVQATTPGWVGVNLFFVLSGFLITGILLDSRDRMDYYRRFYTRRALRILPAYYGILVVLLLVARFGLVERHISWSFVGMSFFYLSNVTVLFGVSMQYGVLWSLAVEEHFYLIWPTVVRKLSRSGVGCVAFGITVLCPALRGLYYILGYQYGSGYTWLVADGLAIGALLAVLARGTLKSRAALMKFSLFCMSGSTLFFIIGKPFGIFLAGRFLGGTLRVTLLNVFFAGFLSATLLLGTGRWKWLVCRPVLQFFGYISYGLYLIHMLAFDVVDHVFRVVWPGLPSPQTHFSILLLRFTIAGGIAVALATFSRKYFEEPFLRMKDRWMANPAPCAVAASAASAS
jgi:peptidoglycan/LPS O-acetylase OafA/YrhL